MIISFINFKWFPGNLSETGVSFFKFKHETFLCSCIFFNMSVPKNGKLVYISWIISSILSLLDLLFIGYVRKDMTKAIALEDLTGVKPCFFSNQHSAIIYDLKKPMDYQLSYRYKFILYGLRLLRLTIKDTYYNTKTLKLTPN
jgi:hypothetical protein